MSKLEILKGSLLGELRSWPSADLQELQSVIQALLDARANTDLPCDRPQNLDSEPSPGPKPCPADSGPGPGRGHVETKTIKGHQYRYLRYWHGGKLRSQYLGKAPKPE